MATVGRCIMAQPSRGGVDYSLINNADEEKVANKDVNSMKMTAAGQAAAIDACKRNNGIVLNCFPDEKRKTTTATTTANGEGAMMKKKKKKVAAVVNSKNKARINGNTSDADTNDGAAVSAKGGGHTSVLNLRSRKDKQSPSPTPPPSTSSSTSTTQTKRPVPVELPDRKRRRSSRHEKIEHQQIAPPTKTSTTSNIESISCCCQEKKIQVENPHDNNNSSSCISQPNNKGSRELLSSASPLYGLPPPISGVALNHERTTTAAGGQSGGPGSTVHAGSLLPLPVPPRPCTPTPPCSTASVSSVVNCALNSSPSSKDSQNCDYNCNKETVTHCKWKNCDIVLDPDLLMAHIREKHVESQEGSEAYVCYWNGCKVYAKRSCSMSWLERHILTHSGDKPFKCIVDGCDMRFPSHHGLERHVNSHFNTQQPAAPKPAKLREDTPTKLWKKKKMKRKRPQLVRTGDFFDSGIMERLQQELVTLTRITQIDLEGSADSITFHGTVIARRTEDSEKVKVLLHWTPENIFPDCWVPECQVEEMSKRVIPLTSLPQETAATLHSSFYRRHRYRKHRRK